MTKKYKQHDVYGEGLLQDIYQKVFRPKNSVSKLDKNQQLYADMAYEAYQRSDSKDNIDGYMKDKSFSQINSIVYTNDSSVILSIRGTNPKIPEDILSDISVATGNLKTSKRYKEIAKRFNDIKIKYPNKKYIIVGHSLGGSLALQLLIDNPNSIDSIHIFNPGTSIDDIKRGLSMKIGKLIGINYYKKISRKIHIYRVTGDLISLTSRFLPGNYTDIQSNTFDRHGMNNFKNIDVDRINQVVNTQKPNLVEVGVKLNEPQMEGGSVNKMTKVQMISFIRSNPKLKISMSGYSKMNKKELHTLLKLTLKS